MKYVINIFKLIQDTPSLNEKKQIITDNKDNKLFKECLVFLLNNNIVTGISDKKIKKKVSDATECTVELNSFENVINYLKVNNTGRDEDVFNIQRFIHTYCTKECCEKQFFNQMVTKKFRLGADAKLVNKCIPDLIPVFNVMLGTSIEKVKLKGDEHVTISRKLNGCRASFIGDKIVSRQGKAFTGLEHIVNDLVKTGYSDMFVDGELLYKNEEGLTDSEAFQKGTGIAMSKDTDKSSLKFVVFDIFPLDEFWKGTSTKTYHNRSIDIQKFQKALFSISSKNIDTVEVLYCGTDHSEIWRWLDKAESNDWEGVMLNLDTQYECKRTKNLIKVKKFHSCDIVCTGIEEGAGRNRGTLGALVCDYKGNSVNVGSGFDDEQRKHIWKNPDKVIGQIITVKYKEETKNKNGGISIQFPVFETIRKDKDTPSYN